MELKAKLNELQKKHPQTKLRALVIEDTDLNFTFTFRKAIGITAIESNRYNGFCTSALLKTEPRLAKQER